MHCLLMPEMDGTGDLFESFRLALAATHPVSVARYPMQKPLTYAELEAHITLPRAPFMLLAESFSGPLAVKLAAQCPPGLKGLVLVASFVRWPGVVPARWARVAAPMLLRRPPPAWAIRRFLVGPDSNDALVEQFHNVMRSVPRDVLVTRLHEIGRVDARQSLAACPVPALFVRARQDRLVHRRALDDMRRCHPAAATATVDGPHLLLQARPDACLAAISPFLEQCRT